MLINELRGGASIGSKKTAALVRILLEDYAASDVQMRPAIPGGPNLHRPLFILTIKIRFITHQILLIYYNLIQLLYYQFIII